jgi:hypothetical protein
MLIMMIWASVTQNAVVAIISIAVSSSSVPSTSVREGVDATLSGN